MQTLQNNTIANDAPLLSPRPQQAVLDMIRMTDAVRVLMEQEMNAMVVNDTASFAGLGHKKEKAATIYQKASQEFQTRLEEFRPLDKSLIRELERTQSELHAITKENVKFFETMKANAEKRSLKILHDSNERAKTLNLNWHPKQDAQQEDATS